MPKMFFTSHERQQKAIIARFGEGVLVARLPGEARTCRLSREWEE
jgi:hypothetical protein